MLRKLMIAAGLSAAVAVTPLVLSASPLTPQSKLVASGQDLVTHAKIKKLPGKFKGPSGGKHHHHHRRGRNIGIGIGIGTGLYALGCVSVREECADIYGYRSGAYYRCVRRRGC